MVTMAIKTELAAWREGINVEDKRNRIFSNDTDKKNQSLHGQSCTALVSIGLILIQGSHTKILVLKITF